MKRCTETNVAWYSERSWTYTQVLYQSLFYMPTLLNMKMVRKVSLILRQTLIDKSPSIRDKYKILITVSYRVE
jgi:hypothetical protein